MKKLLVKNIGLLATPEGKSAHRGEEQGKIKFLKDAWVLIEDGIIASVGTGAVPAVEGAEVVDAEGHLVTPGLVDAHTHLIFGGWRQNELGLKLHGASYLDIQNAGGGIQSTTNATRQASEQELAAKASKALDEMMGFGTTTVEAKSGYGLATEHELKALEVIKDLNDHHRMDLVATFMGAHLVPAEYKSNRAEYIRLVCEEMMPKVKEQGIAKFCDVFCEADTFTVEESRQVLEAGLKYGLRPKIHADEIEAIGGSQLAGEVAEIFFLQLGAAAGRDVPGPQTFGVDAVGGEELDLARVQQGSHRIGHPIVLPVVKAAAPRGQSQHRHTGAAIYLKLHLAVQHTAPLFVIGTLHHNQSSTPFLS